MNNDYKQQTTINETLYVHIYVHNNFPATVQILCLTHTENLEGNKKKDREMKEISRFCLNLNFVFKSSESKNKKRLFFVHIYRVDICEFIKR